MDVLAIDRHAVGGTPRIAIHTTAVSVGSLMLRSWNRVGEWLREIAAVRGSCWGECAQRQ